jgi:hypothetical protein
VYTKDPVLGEGFSSMPCSVDTAAVVDAHTNHSCLPGFTLR